MCIVFWQQHLIFPVFEWESVYLLHCPWFGNSFENEWMRTFAGHFPSTHTLLPTLAGTVKVAPLTSTINCIIDFKFSHIGRSPSPFPERSLCFGLRAAFMLVLISDAISYWFLCCTTMFDGLIGSQYLETNLSKSSGPCQRRPRLCPNHGWPTISGVCVWVECVWVEGIMVLPGHSWLVIPRNEPAFHLQGGWNLWRAKPGNSRKKIPSKHTRGQVTARERLN